MYVVIDFVLDPATVVASLAKSGITTEEYVYIFDSFFHMIIAAMSRQLPDGMLEELKDVINASTNLNIIPTSVHEQAGGILPHRTQTLICFSRKELLRMLRLSKMMPKRNNW